MADSKTSDPHLDQDKIDKYWPPEKGSREIPGLASQIIGDAAMVAVGASPIRDPSAVNHARETLDRLVQDFPESARKEVERLRAPGNDPDVYRDAIKLIAHDLEHQQEISAPGATPAAQSGSRKPPHR
jgi:hypothetical protein